MTTPQAPIGSGFTAAATASDVTRGLDLSGKVAIVTGGYSGIGIETVRALASAGARVVVPARDIQKARRALDGMSGVSIDALDLMDPLSIDAFADRFMADNPALHILINNAAGMGGALVRDSRGYESQFATNHLGHFQLTMRLWPALQRAQGARVVTVSSCGHRIAGVDFDDPNFEHRAYDPGLAYGQSKTANALFAVSLDALGKAHGIRAFSLHPGGMIMSGLTRHYTAEQIRASGYVDAQGRAIIDPDNNMKSLEQGAATSVWCATSPQLDGMGGVYCENCDIAGTAPAESTDLLGVRPWATSPQLAERLWHLSERLAGSEHPGRNGSLTG